MEAHDVAEPQQLTWDDDDVRHEGEESEGRAGWVPLGVRLPETDRAPAAEIRRIQEHLAYLKEHPEERARLIEGGRRRLALERKNRRGSRSTEVVVMYFDGDPPDDQRAHHEASWRRAASNIDRPIRVVMKTRHPRSEKASPVEKSRVVAVFDIARRRTIARPLRTARPRAARRRTGSTARSRARSPDDSHEPPDIAIGARRRAGAAAWTEAGTP